MQQRSTNQADASQSDAGELRTQIQLLSRRMQSFERYHNLKGRQIPVSYAQALIVLLRFHEQSQNPTLSELVILLDIDKSNVTRLCQRMLEYGHVQMKRDSRDRRAKRIGLTDKGTKLAKHVDEDSLERFSKVVDDFNPEECSALLDHLEKLNALLEAHTENF